MLARGGWPGVPAGLIEQIDLDSQTVVIMASREAVRRATEYEHWATPIWGA
jgi:hypothetical protein